MFMGSQHVPVGAFVRCLSRPGNNNGSTTEDRTNYYETLPSNALALASGSTPTMGFLLPTMDLAKVDLQRDVVKNERRQRVDNGRMAARTRSFWRRSAKAHPYCGR
jgi:zinc protease